MEILKEWPVKLQLVRTKRGSLIYRILIDENWFFLEQNPLKNSKYGFAYRNIKEKYPEFYMFWEFKNNKYTKKLLIATLLEKKEMDNFLEDLLNKEQGEEFKKLKDKSEEENKERFIEIKE